MLFRDFVEQNKDAMQAEVGAMPGTDPAPVLTLDTPRGVMLVQLDPRSFDSRLSRIELVHGFAIPMIAEHGATQVAWSFAAWLASNSQVRPSQDPNRQEAVVVTVIDRERHEVWQGELHRNGSQAMIAGWHPWAPNEADGPLLIQPIQEALR